MLKTKRLPRPQGSTYLAIKRSQSEDESERENIHQTLLKHLVTLYTTEGFRWNGIPTNIVQLATILKQPQSVIMDLVSQAGTNMGSLASPQNINNTLQSLITLSTSFSIQDRGLIMQQLELLLSSQDGKYKPFVSSEVNKTLKLALDSNKNIQDLYKTLTTQSPITNILIQSADTSDSKEYLSPDQAIALVNKERKSLSNTKDLPNIPNPSAKSDTSDLAEELGDRYGIADLEDVLERRSGTEALEARKEGSRKAHEPARPATTTIHDHADDGGFKRRGYEVEDVDELP